MKFTKYGKTLLMSALSAGVILSLTSCVQSYSVGYLYVTGTKTSESSGNGIISGFKIDHNTGKLNSLNGLPVSSGGANPIRAVLLSGSHFVYVLNRGANAEGGSDCTQADPCTGSNITEFAVGANGVLTAEQTFNTQGRNPFRLLADSNGSHLYVLDHDSPDNLSGATGAANGCAQALNGATTCADITAFSVDSTTGRLSLVQNLQVKVTTTASGTQNLSYFPVPANPIDFVLASSNILTLTGTPGIADAPQTIFPYAYTSSSGQLSRTLNSSESIGSVYEATALVYSGNYLWVLDNEPPPSPNSTNARSQILPWTVSTGGSLTAPATGHIADDATQSNPVYLVVESKGDRFYVANQGSSSDKTDALSGIAGYTENTPFDPTSIGSSSLDIGTGAGPVCMVEDPSDQFFYTANFDSSTITGLQLDPKSGELRSLSDATKAPSKYDLPGQPTWCFVSGHTG
jgi:6-phosphogluconolactonase (cycloisomerase 2 family)